MRNFTHNLGTWSRGNMSLVLTLMIVFCLQLTTTANSVAQTTKVSLKVENVTLSDALNKLSLDNGVKIFFNGDQADFKKRVSVDFKNAELTVVLKALLANTNLRYELENGTVVVSPVKRAPTATTSAAKTVDPIITGKVTSESGLPLEYVSVTVKGTNTGMVTDAKGVYNIPAPKSDAVLVFNLIGYIPVEQAVAGRKEVNVTLKESVAKVEEIVVTGIFDRNASTYTGSVTTLKREDLQRVGNNNILQSLKNLDPSFQVVVNNEFGSDPNKVPEIQMRGASSFSDMKDKYQTNPNQPLFIVDGFEQSVQKVMDMDMNRVASVTLLKDATAKALYGSKGANGVVVIETIAPEKGRIKVSYMGNFSVTTPDLTSYTLANAAEKLEIERRAGVYTAYSNSTNPNYNPNPLTQQALDEKYNIIYSDVLKGVDTYWLSKPLRTSFGHKHSLNLEGGDDSFRYGIDFGYNSIPGVMKGSGREVISGGVLFQYRYKKLLFKNQLSVLFNSADDSPYGSFSEYSKLNPYWRAYNEDGSIREVFGDYNIANQQGNHPIYNPLTNADINTKYASQYTDITNNFYVEYEAFDGMKLKGRFGFVSNNNSAETFLPRDHTSFRDIDIESEDYWKRGRYTMTNGKRFDYSTDISANYSKQIKKHLIFANAQWSLSENKASDVIFGAQGFANNRMDYITNALEYVNGSPTGNESLARELSVLASANYSYDSRYLVDATYRANASSIFGKDRRWGGFWSAGIGWNIHNEAFFAEAEWLQKMKLRASTGYTGSQNFSTYQAIATYKDYNESYDNIIGSYLMSAANPNLRWQKTQDNNIGLELSVLNALDVTVDFYIKNTNNLLAPVAIPPSAGFNSYTENIGTTRNTGFEGRVNYRIISNHAQGIYFSVFGSVMHNKNKIMKISDALSVMNNQRDKEMTDGTNIPNHEKDKDKVTKPTTRYHEGQSLDAIWAVRSLGIDPFTGKEVFLSLDGNEVYAWDPKNQVVIGDKMPKFSGTFGFNFEYKGFSVNTSFFFRAGGQYYNQTLADKIENGDIQYNVDRRMLSDRWSTPGVAAKFKKFNSSSPFTQPTSRFVQNQNELEMTSLNVGYDFRFHNFIKSKSIERLKLMFYMNDVFRASTIKAERGTEYPFSRTFSFSIQATF